MREVLVVSVKDLNGDWTMLKARELRLVQQVVVERRGVEVVIRGAVARRSQPPPEDEA